MRRSHEGLRGIIKYDYFGLPEELKEFNYYYPDGEKFIECDKLGR